MEMFDTVIFKCLKCKTLIEEQTKAGECRLIDYSRSQVPIVIAESLEGNELQCPNCKEIWIMRAETHPKTVAMFLSERD